jgi:hypothetical protein
MKNLTFLMLLISATLCPDVHAYPSLLSFEFELLLPELQTEDPKIRTDILVQKDTPSPIVVVKIALTDSSRDETSILAIDEIGPDLFPEKGRRVWISESYMRLDLCENVSDLPKCTGSQQHLLGLGHSVARDDITDVQVYTQGINTSSRTLSVTIQITFEVHKDRQAATAASHIGEGAAAGLFTERHYYLDNSTRKSISTVAHTAETLSSSDVLGYFGLYPKYDTPLKQRVFKRSKEYKQLKTLLARVQKAVPKRPKFCHPVRLSTYDLKRKGFQITDGLREDTLTLDVRYLGRNTSRELKGLRDFIKVNEDLGLDIENANAVAMCFKILRLKPKTRTHRYQPERQILRMFTPAQRAFFRKNPMKTVFREYHVEATHFVIGSLEAPMRVLNVKKGQIVQ